MSNGQFRNGTVLFSSVTSDDIPSMQTVLDQAHYYHTTVLQQSSSGLGERCFRAPLPEVSGSRVFRHLVLVDDDLLPHHPSAVLDIFVGFPNYRIASVAMFVIREDSQRKGLGTRVLTRSLPAFVREYHPAVETLSVSLTENNVPALRCLLSCRYTRTSRWEKLDINGRPIIAVTFRRSISDLLSDADRDS